MHTTSHMDKFLQTNNVCHHDTVLTICFLFSDLKQLQAKPASNEDLEKLKKNFLEERMKKEQAVNKLAEIMNRKEFRNQDKKRNHASAQELKKKEKECRKLQQELAMV